MAMVRIRKELFGRYFLSDGECEPLEWIEKDGMQGCRYYKTLPQAIRAKQRILIQYKEINNDRRI